MFAHYKGNINKLFLIVFANSFILAYVIERIFALDRGLSILEMQYILIIYSVTSLILEVPFGVLADKWKKKYVLSLGILFCSFEFLISIYSYNFTVFSLAFLLAAVGGSLKSGIMDSILFQTLKGMDRGQEYEKFKGYITFLKYMTSGIAGILGGYVAHHYGLEYSYWLSLIGLPLAALISLTLYEPAINDRKKAVLDRRRHSQLKKFSVHIKKSMAIIGRKPILLQVILFGSITGAVLYGQLHEMSSILYLDMGIPLHMFGFASFLIMVCGGLAGIWAYKVKDKFGYSLTFGAILTIAIITIFLYSGATQWWNIGYLFIAIFVMEMITPLTSGFIHRRIADQYRVTISSFDGFVKNAVIILVSLLFGFVAEQWNINVAFQMMSILLLIYGLTIVMSKLLLSKGSSWSRLKYGR